ncbi:MAG: DegT/DnrJ/EryC1/StrS family aminotransferase [Ginsengibacter sp.]
MAYKIPLFDLNFSDLEGKAVSETIKEGWISTGPKCLAFEKKFAQMLNVKHAVSVANCTTALHLAYEGLGIDEADEVICPSLTFVATVNAIRYLKATPVFCDIVSPENLNIDPSKIEELITHKTKAIVVMHFAGFPVDMDKIMSIAKTYNLKVIEDACHGPLSEYKGQKLGSIGDAGCFSFFSNKNISTGEGGMVVTNNPGLDAQVRLKRSHGMTSMSYQRATGHSTEYDVVSVGYNYRMDDIHASIGIVQLDKIQKDLEKRAIVRESYLEKLKRMEDRIIIPFKDNTEFVSNYIFPIVIKNCNKIIRNNIRNRMHQLGVQTSVHYPAVHNFSIYKQFKDRANLPITEEVVDSEITLPMYSKLTGENIAFVANCLEDSLEKANG